MRRILRARRSRTISSDLFFVTALCLVVLMQGCGRKGQEEQAGSSSTSQGQSATILAYPSTLSAQSSPEEVARTLIDALDTGRKKTLLGLVAVKQGSADIEAIYRKYGRESNTKPEAVAALAVAGWAGTCAFYVPGEIQVERQEVRGDSAAVFASGTTRGGKRSTLEITLVREDGFWKVCPGIHVLSK